MANYSLVLNTKFNPFSYQEMLAPVMAATQAHQALESEYGDLATKASVWERMANEQTDPEAYRMYKTYSEDLENMAEQLARTGLDPTSRRNMMGMKARYSSEILPIETAYKRREELAAEQRKAMVQNHTLRYQRMASQMSLDDFIRNPSLDYGKSYSGALLTQQVNQAAANLQRALTDKGQLQKIGLPYQYERMLQYGATPSQVLAAMAEQAQNEPETATFLRSIVDNVMRSSGVEDWADPATLREFRAFANQGLYGAIGQAKPDNFIDQAGLAQFKADLDGINAIRAERRKAARTEEEDKAKRLRMYRNNTSRLFSESEVANANRATLDELDKWRNKGYINDNGQLTLKGWDAMKNQLLYVASGAANSESSYVRARSYTGRDEEFLTWTTQRGVKYTVPTKVQNQDADGRIFYTYSDPTLQGYGDMTNYYNKTRQAAANGEFVTGIANIKVLRNRVSSNKTKQDDLVNLITSAHSPIYEVGALQASGILKQGREFSATEFRNLVKDNPIVHLANNPVGNQQLVELSNGQRFFIPKSVFGESLVNPLAKSYEEMGDLDIANAMIRASQEGSDDAITASANASAYLSSILDTTEGDDINYHGSITEEELDQ